MHNANAERVRRWLTLFLCVLLTTVAVIPFFYIGEDRAVGCCGGEMPVTHDSWMHLNQMQSFVRGLAAGRVYPRWDDATDQGYGAPTTCFYPPGVYYITSLAYGLTRDWIRTWMLTYWLISLAAGLAMYAYARRYLTQTAAWLAMAVYTVAPYHLLDQYQRGAQSESLSFVWMPCCLLFAERLLDREKPLASALGLAASYGGFLWSHPPTAYQFTLVAGLCLLARVIRFKQWQALGWIAASLAGGSLLAAAYFYPATFEQRFIHADDVNKTWPYHMTYVFDYVQTGFDHNDWFLARVDWLWMTNTLLLALAGALCAWWPRQANDKGRRTLQLATWLGMGTLAAFLMTRLSLPIGRWLPGIEIGVFAWRMLGITSLALALLLGACWQAAGARRVLAILISGIVVALSYHYVMWPMLRGEAFAPNPQHYNFATLPATAPREVPARPPAQFAETDAGQVTVQSWQPERRVMQATTNKPAQLQLRTFDYPGWTALLNGQVVPHARGQFGEIVLPLPAGSHQIEFEFRNTPLRAVSNWITLFAAGAWLVLWIRARKRSVGFQPARTMSKQ